MRIYQAQRAGVRQYNKSDLPRLRWTPELHEQFDRAVQRLGGKYKATPKRILQAMNTKGLKISHIKSHLQMYRSMKDHNGNDVMRTRKNLQRADRKIDRVLSFSSPDQRQVGNGGIIDWESERSIIIDNVKPEVLSEESNRLVHAQEVAAAYAKHQESETSNYGKICREDVGGSNGFCELSLSFGTPMMMMMTNEEERESRPRPSITDPRNNHQSTSIDHIFVNNIPDYHSLPTNHDLNLDLTI